MLMVLLQSCSALNTLLNMRLYSLKVQNEEDNSCGYFLWWCMQHIQYLEEFVCLILAGFVLSSNSAVINL